MAVEEPGKVNFATRSFLLIEDFEAMRGILRDLLRRCGARRIDVAANAKEAQQVLRRCKGKVDVVLCDYHLGPGKNGQQLLAEARHDGLLNASTIWIMVTAEKTVDMVMGAFEHQPDDYLLKPVNEATLHTRLEKLIKRKAVLSGISAAKRAKDYAKAICLCQTALALDPGNPMEIMRIQAELYQLLGQTDKARRIFEAILGRRDVHWARTGLAKIDIQDGHFGRARDQLEQLLADNPNCLEAYDVLALAYQRQGAWCDAQRVLSDALDVSPNSAQRQTALGECALRCEDLPIAEEAFRKALKLSSPSAIKMPAPYLGLARVLTAQNKSGDALKLLAQLVSEVSGEESRLQAKAEEFRVHHALGNPALAATAAQEVTSAIRSGAHALSPSATLDLAETFMVMGNKTVASDLLQFVMRNNHEDETLASRVLKLFETGGMGEEGQALVHASRQQAVDALDHGVELASLGKFDEALDFLNQARALMPRNPRLLLNYSDVLISLLKKNGWRYDLASDARRAIATARQIVPGEKRCTELLAKLEALH